MQHFSLRWKSFPQQHTEVQFPLRNLCARAVSDHNLQLGPAPSHIVPVFMGGILFLWKCFYMQPREIMSALQGWTESWILDFIYADFFNPTKYILYKK